MSGFFQGYCQMTSSVGWRRENIWSQGSGKNPWGRSFKVKWLRLYDLPFQKTLHLKNPLNDYEPVKISRDCQELPQDIGEALCDLLDGKDDINANIERDDLLFKRPYVETHCGNMDPQWGPTPMPYPPFFYQNQVEANRFLFAHMPSISSTLTEDEILEMSYEEYLEVHRKRNKRPCHPDTGKSRRTQESMSKERNDDSYSDSRSSKKSYHSTRK